MSVSWNVRVMRTHHVCISIGLPGSSHATGLLRCRMASASNTYEAAARSSKQTKRVATKTALADNTPPSQKLYTCTDLISKRHKGQKHRQQDQQYQEHIYKHRKYRQAVNAMQATQNFARVHLAAEPPFTRAFLRPVLQQPQPAHPHTRARAPTAA